MTTTTFKLHSSTRRAAEPFGRALARAYASLVARFDAWNRSTEPNLAQTAARLRALADQYRSQPSYAADLRAAADRHDNFGQRAEG
ncbi:MAG TPA: hypothetical protein VJ598_13590 [Albitalea sp.]|nr:hypothetical protein [Albitalea sp.]